MQAALITLLSSGEVRSGEELGSALGVTRAAVWKQLKRLEQIGIEVEVIKGKGYRLRQPLSLLDEQAVRAAMTTEALGIIRVLEVFEELPSTNAYLMERAAGGGAHAWAVSAETQTQGRGRRGRVWQSPYARNIYVSLGWTFQGGAAALEGLSLAVGVAIIRALSELGFAGAQLKWPNDVVHEGRKLAGILLELVGDADDACHVVVGLGLNVAMTDRQADLIDQPWTDLHRMAGASPDRNRVLGTVLSHLLQTLPQFSAEGFVAFRKEWQQLDAFAGRAVTLHSGSGDAVHGIARGVDAHGALMLETPGGMQLFHGGEVSLRANP